MLKKLMNRDSKDIIMLQRISVW